MGKRRFHQRFIAFVDVLGSAALSNECQVKMIIQDCPRCIKDVDQQSQERQYRREQNKRKRRCIRVSRH
jgi:hypothetical protein